MGKYDVGKSYTDECELTLIELADEICEEQENTKDRETDYIYLKKIKGNSGIIKLLKDKLNFDVEAYAGDDKEKRFKMLQFLKMLFYVEKIDGKASCIMLLRSPHLENITTEYSEGSKNDDIYRLIYKRTIELISESDAAQRHAIYHKVNYLLEQKIGIARAMIGSLNVKNPPTVENLNDIEKKVFYFQKELERIYSKPVQIQDGIAESFFDLLICHQIKSNDADKISMNLQLYDLKIPYESYINKYKKEFDVKVGVNGFKAMEEKIKKGNESEIGDKIWNLITYYNYDVNDMRYYNYAVDKYNMIIDLKYRSVTRDENYEEDGSYNPYSEPLHQAIKAVFDCTNDVRDEITLGELVSIMQELIYIRKNKTKFENRYYNYKDVSKTLTSKLRKGEKSEAAAIRYFIRCHENREATNIGRGELMKSWRVIETYLYRIKMTLFSIYNIGEFLSTYKQINFFMDLL